MKSQSSSARPAQRTGATVTPSSESRSVSSEDASKPSESPRILVRNNDPTFPMPTGRYFWAGDAPCPPDVEPLP